MAEDNGTTMHDEEITSEHTCFRIEQVLEEIEALRMEMGRSTDARVPMHVRDASPREVFYHAQTVHRKANQLCVELGAGSVNAPSAESPARARPADVLQVLDSTRERLARARAHLRLEHDDAPRPELPGPLGRVQGKVASDVLSGCLLASRQLNVMLAMSFTSREAHEQLVRALGFAERLLGTLGRELPAPPPFEPRKFPREVFEVLWQTGKVLQSTLAASGLHVLVMSRGYVGEAPSDVYDIASLLVSELEYAASFFPVKGAAMQLPAAPVPTLPAHNYRRARQLQAAVELIAEGAASTPSWLAVARN